MRFGSAGPGFQFLPDVENAVMGSGNMGILQRLGSWRGLSLMFLDAQAGEGYKANLTLVKGP